MPYWLRGKRGGTVGFVLIAALVAGGLGWVTAAALRLEREQREAALRAEHDDKLRLALWRLDARVVPVLAREDSRPYNHFSAVYAPALALKHDGTAWPPGTVLEPSPLLNAELPDWVLLHFQTDGDFGWSSPQVISPALAERLGKAPIDVPADSARRAIVLRDLSQSVTPPVLLAQVRPRATQPRLEDTTLVLQNSMNYDGQANPNAANQAAQQPVSEYKTRTAQKLKLQQETKENSKPGNDEDPVALGNVLANGENWLSPAAQRPRRGEKTPVNVGSMAPFWLTTPQRQWLVVARLVRVGNREVCQGMLLDWPRLQQVLAAEVEDLFPQAQFEARAEEEPSESDMTALPVRLDPRPDPDSLLSIGWTPLRFGLALAWVAALVALAAVGLGGWSLLDLSERRIRFVSAVTHELRTPLTTLRLYLDMLAGGLVKGEKQQAEYLSTLNAETERLHRLVSNVLDFSRLENQRPRLEKTAFSVPELLEQVRSAWESRCTAAGKELTVESTVGDEPLLLTDMQLVQQILGNLIDNACKYSRGAEDGRVWLRARLANRTHLALEVEDRGPGIPAGERRAIFRAFRRGRSSEVTAGGVGLGLALARRWTQLLGGTLDLDTATLGARFRLTLPFAPS